MDDQIRALVLRQIIGRLPPSVQDDVIDDPRAASAVGWIRAAAISFEGQDLSVPAESFFEAITKAYAQPGHAIQAATEPGIVEIIHDPASPHALRVQAGDASFTIPGRYEVRERAKERERGFDEALRAAGLARSALPSWRKRLKQRPLRHDEILELEQRLGDTPASLCPQMTARLAARRPVDDLLVPAATGYYERLIGGGQPTTVQEMARDGVPVLARELLEWDAVEGAKLLVLLATHGEMMAHVDWSGLDPEHWRELCRWAISQPDPFSRLGVVDIALPRVAQQPDIATDLEAVVAGLCAEDPRDEAGNLYIFTSLFVLVDAELGRLGIAAGWPPFRRRAASLAQAGLLQRQLAGVVDLAQTAAVAFSRYGSRFLTQCYADLRLEPRWLPNAIDPVQLKAELMGRLSIIGQKYATGLPAGNLLDRLTGDHPDGVAKHLRVPQSHQPGPLEGAVSAHQQALPDELARTLEASLTAERLDGASIAGLINLQGVFAIPAELLDRTVALIKAAGHRCATDGDEELAQSLIGGLATVACVSRSPEIAGQVRIMCRQRRADNPDAFLHPEIIWALTAAGAHEDAKEWRGFISEWVQEIAFTVSNKEDAGRIWAELEQLCVLVPSLRCGLARPMMAIEAFVAS